MDKLGIIHGRFQMLHLGHMEYLLAGKARCEHLIIGICNPAPELTAYSGANPHRSLPSSNPLTYFERYEMIKGALIEAGVPQDQFDIVPFPINFPNMLFNYVPMNAGAKFYMTIYDAWSLEKKKELEDLHCDVEVMWQRSNDQKFTSGSEVRRRIRNDEKWDHLVPPYVYNYTITHGLVERIKLLGE